MHDWKSLVRKRSEPLKLKPAEEPAFIEELAQHLEDVYRETRSGGASDAEAYRKTIAELDDLHPVRAGSKKTEPPPHDYPVNADGRAGSVVQDLWRDIRYAVRTMLKNPMVVLFVVGILGMR